jgi:hypothetical protein
MNDSTQQYPTEFAFLRQLPPAELRQWVIDHSTPRSSQLEAQIDGINREAAPG